MVTRIYLLVIFLGVFDAAVGKLPSFIHACKRNDPKIEQCIINAIEELKPRLVKGIPELDVPALEPMYLPELAISKGLNFRAVGKDVVVRGSSNFRITKFKADIQKVYFKVGLYIPELKYVAKYDIDLKLLTLVLRGKGPLEANTTGNEAVAIIRGHKEQRNGNTYIKFDSINVKLKWKKYQIKLENLFNGDKTLGVAVNRALNENQLEIAEVIKPLAEEVTSEVLLEIANKITKKFTYDELYPL